MPFLVSHRFLKYCRFRLPHLLPVIEMNNLYRESMRLMMITVHRIPRTDEWSVDRSVVWKMQNAGWHFCRSGRDGTGRRHRRLGGAVSIRIRSLAWSHTCWHHGSQNGVNGRPFDLSWTHRQTNIAPPRVISHALQHFHPLQAERVSKRNTLEPSEENSPGKCRTMTSPRLKFLFIGK